jgi:cyanate permease
VPEWLGGVVSLDGAFPHLLADWRPGVAWIVGLLVIALWLPNSQRIVLGHAGPLATRDDRGGGALWRPNAAWAVTLGVVSTACLIAILLEDSVEFLYFQF